MIKPVMRTVAVLTALAMLAAPALACCHDPAGEIDAVAADTAAASGHMAGGSMHDHCGETGTEPEKPPAGDHEAGCDGCPACPAVQTAAPWNTAGISALVKQADYAPAAAILPAQAGFVPALLRATGPPRGAPAAHRTPVALNTTLRL